MNKRIFLTFSVALFFTNLQAYELKKIPESEITNHSQSNRLPHSVSKKDNSHKLKIKIYKNIKYDKSLLLFSLFKPDKEIYKKYLEKKDINKFYLKKIFGKDSSELSILVSAFGYDWVYHKPEIAENFYKLIKTKKIDTRDKIYVADYYLRTGRPGMIIKVLSKINCLTSFKYRRQCFYYLGLKKFLVDGKSHNLYFRLIKGQLPAAEEIWEKYN